MADLRSQTLDVVDLIVAYVGVVLDVLLQVGNLCTLHPSRDGGRGGEVDQASISLLRPTWVFRPMGLRLSFLASSQPLGASSHPVANSPPPSPLPSLPSLPPDLGSRLAAA